MNSKEIYSILENDEWVKKMNFIGVFPVDRIPSCSLTDYPCCGVVNTKPHNHPGEHWVMFLKTENNTGVYFDSFGSGLYNMPEVAAIFDSVDSWQFSSTQLQSVFSTVCGQYCIFVLTHLARGFSLEHIISLINYCCDMIHTQMMLLYLITLIKNIVIF